MRGHGQASVSKTYISVGRASDTKNWYEQIRDRWTAYKAARREAKLVTLRARWDSRREAVLPLHADAAIDMVASTHVFTMTTPL
jgi:hypothetical protein